MLAGSVGQDDAGVHRGVFHGGIPMRFLLFAQGERIRDGKIVYKESGVQAIENYILARYHMYWQVYYHPTARSYEHLLQLSLINISSQLYIRKKKRNFFLLYNFQSYYNIMFSVSIFLGVNSL